MEPARIRKEETGMYLTHKDLERMGLTRKGKWQYTVADIEALPEDVFAELIDGELFVRMEMPSPTHQDIVTGLGFQIELYIQKKRGKCRMFSAPIGVYIKKDIHNYVGPDITLICDEDMIDGKGCQGAPDFVAEVVSPSNRKMDYVRKLALYREAGVREYWIVDPKHEQVTVYDFTHEKEPELHPFTERIRVGIYDDLYIDLANRHNAYEEAVSADLKASRMEALAEGRAEGEARFAELTAFLLRENRTDDLHRAITDPAYRDELYRQYRDASVEL